MTKQPEVWEERRYPVEFRSQKGRRLTGRLLTYGRQYDLGRFTETYSPGCFRKSIGESARRLPLMIEHGHQSIPVGVSVAWQDDENALQGTWEFDTRAEAVEASRLADSGFLGGLSVGFTPIITDWTERPDGRHHALRKEARIIETSLCSLPALDDAGVIAVRSLGYQVASPTPQLDAARQWLLSVRSGSLTNNG